jgi:mannosyltransferase OCH1-like enzyme
MFEIFYRFIVFLRDLINYYPYKYIENREALILRKQKIPLIVHQVWIEKKIGRLHRKSVEIFRRLNPDCSFHIYNDFEMDNYMKKRWGQHMIFDVYKKSVFGPMKADIFRYCKIYDEGGYYFDISKSLLTQISSLHDSNTLALISFESNISPILPNMKACDSVLFPENLILQWGFGFAPRHDFLKCTIDNIVKYSVFFKHRSYEIPKNAIISLTGPGMFTKSIHECLGKKKYDNLTQAGIDFNSTAIYRIPGSNSRYLLKPSYSRHRKEKILND